MTRNMDTIRRILIAVEDSTAPIEAIPDCDNGVFSYHVALLIEAGLVRGDFTDGRAELAAHGWVHLSTHMVGP